MAKNKEPKKNLEPKKNPKPEVIVEPKPAKKIERTPLSYLEDEVKSLFLRVKALEDWKNHVEMHGI